MKNYKRRSKSLIKLFSSEKGFTLTEMLVAVTILGILVTMAVIGLNPGEQIKKANDAKRKDDLSEVQKALEIYYQDKGTYPSTLSWGNSWPPYMQKLPNDPGSKKYVYFSPATSNGQTYYIYANLERGGKDPQACFTNGNACSGAQANGLSSACGGTCNYGVSSANVTP